MGEALTFAVGLAAKIFSAGSLAREALAIVLRRFAATPIAAESFGSRDKALIPLRSREIGR